MEYLSQKFAESQRLESIATDTGAATNQEFVSAAGKVWDRAFGTPAQSIDVKSSDGSMTPQVWVFGAKPVEF